MSCSQGFPKSTRLLNAKDYSRVFDNVSVRVSSRHFLVLATLNQNLGSRLGVIVAKKHVKLAVQRNRIKRLIRESFRHSILNQHRYDLVVLAKKGADLQANGSSFDELDMLFRKLARKQLPKAK